MKKNPAQFSRSMHVIVDLNKHVKKRNKVKLFLLISSAIFASAFEALLLLTLYPMISSVLTDDNSMLEELNSLIGVDLSFSEYGVALIFIIVVSTFLRLFVLRYTGIVSAQVGSSLGQEIYKGLASSSYEDFNQYDKNFIISTLSTNLNDLTQFIVSCVKVIAAVSIVLALSIGLLSINYRITLGSLFCLVVIYIIIARASRGRLLRNSIEVKQCRETQINMINNLLNGFDSFKFISDINYFLTSYKRDDYTSRQRFAESQFIGACPKYLLEAVVLISVILLIIISPSPESFGLLAVFLLAAQRLMPAAQQLYSSVAYIRSVSFSVESCLILLDKTVVSRKNYKIFEKETKSYSKIDKIKCTGVEYWYPDKPHITYNLNSTFVAGKIYAIVGRSGSGKSTLTKLVVGLLHPKRGKISYYLNDREVPKVEIFQHVSYINQSPFLMNGSPAFNITFEDNLHKINLEALRLAISKSGCSDFIDESNLFNVNLVTNNGSNLSGGQKQRIALARSFYKESSIVVLDESTNALDKGLERLILSNLSLSKSGKIIICITHSLQGARSLYDEIVDLSLPTSHSLSE